MCCGPTGNDRFQEDFRIGLDERNQVNVVLDDDRRNLLPGVTVLVGMIEQIDFISIGDVENDLLERNVSVPSQPFILVRIPVVVLHYLSLVGWMPNVITTILGYCWLYPVSTEFFGDPTGFWSVNHPTRNPTDYLNIYVSDLDGGKVFKWMPTGEVVVLAELPGKGNEHAVVGGGALYVNKIWDLVLYRVELDTGAFGIVTGNGPAGYEDGPIGVATIEEPNGIASNTARDVVYFNRFES